MKEHPIDQLFANKLHSLEKEPSQLLWGKIEARQKQPLQAFKWYYAVASVVLLLAVLGGRFWLNEQEETTRQALTTVQPPVEIVLLIPNYGKIKRIAAECRSNRATKSVLVVNKLKPVYKAPTPAEQHKATVTSEQQRIHLSTNSTVTELKRVVELTIAMGDSLPTKEKAVGTVENGKQALLVQQPATNTKRISRILKELKKLKDGQRPSLREMGLRSGTILSLVKFESKTKEETRK